MLVLLNSVAANTTGTSVFPQTSQGERTKTIVHTTITGTAATITIQGRTSPNMGWATLATVSTVGDTATEVLLMPEMRAVSSAMTAATARAELAEY